MVKYGIPKTSPMRTIITLSLILCAIFSSDISAQSPNNENWENDARPARLTKYKIVDKSFMECVYEHCIYDPYFDKTEIHDEILEIGRKESRYSEYNRYLRDSIIAVDYPNGLTKGEFYKISKKVGASRTAETNKNFEGNKLKHYESIFGENYVYEEDIPTFDWKFTDETDEICGYKCRKATAEFRGRTWNAWYAEDIPVDNGPFKFGGLPGLILKVEDTNKEHIFEAMQVRKSDKEFGYKIQSFLIPTDREKFNKMMLDYKMDVGSVISTSQYALANPDGTPKKIGKRRVFFNPVEKD